MAITIIDDDFNRGDTAAGTIGNGWSERGGVFHIDGNTLYMDDSATSGYQKSAYYPDSKRAVRVTWTTPSVVTDRSGFAGGIACTGLVTARLNAMDGTCYAAIFTLGDQYFGVQKCTDGATGSYIGSGASVPVTSTPKQYVIVLTVEDGPGAGETTVTATIATAADPGTILATVGGPDSEASLQRSGYAGIGCDGNFGHDHTVATHFLYEDLESALPSAGTITQGTLDGVNHVVASDEDASGGTGSPTYSWYRARTLLFTPGVGNVIGGATSATFSGTAPDGEVWYYIRRATDEADATADTSPVAIIRGYPSYRIGQIGDSITDVSALQTYINGYLKYFTGTRSTATVFNAAKAGAYLADAEGREEYFVIQPSLEESFYNVTDGVTDILAANNCNVASIRLGINDSSGSVTDATAYGEALDLLIVDLLDVQGMDFVVLHAPTYGHFTADASGSSRTALLESYRAQLLARVNHTTVFAGDFESWYYVAAHPEELVDTVHPITHEQLALFEARGLLRAFNEREQRGLLALTVRGPVTVTVSN